MARQLRKPLPCAQCNARCCRYMALKVATPQTEDDYEDMRWYLLHQGVRALVDPEGIWYLSFDNPCERIGKDGKCLQYETRPQICRDYPRKDDPCESTGTLFVHTFHTPEELDAWLKREPAGALP